MLIPVPIKAPAVAPTTINAATPVIGAAAPNVKTVNVANPTKVMPVNNHANQSGIAPVVSVALIGSLKQYA